MTANATFLSVRMTIKGNPENEVAAERVAAESVATCSKRTRYYILYCVKEVLSFEDIKFSTLC